MFRNYLLALAGSFYNPATYREALQIWPGFGGKYLALLSTVLAFMLMVSFFIVITIFETKELPHILNQIPALEINEGVIKVDAKQPVNIYSRDKKINITIDTNKSESELRDTKTQIGIGKDFFFVHEKNQYKVFYTKDMKLENFKITPEILKGMWRQNIPFVKLIALPLLWLGRFIDLMVKCVIVAVISYAVTAFMPEEFNFITRIRLAALAITPPEIIAMLLNVTIGHHSAWPFTLLLSSLYIFVKLQLMRRLPSPVVREETL